MRGAGPVCGVVFVSLYVLCKDRIDGVIGEIIPIDHGEICGEGGSVPLGASDLSVRTGHGLWVFNKLVHFINFSETDCNLCNFYVALFRVKNPSLHAPFRVLR